MSGNNDNKPSLFNKKYLSISLYALLVIFLGTFIIKAITDWQSVSGILNAVIKVLSPFIMGFCFAFILNPLAIWFQKNVFQKIFHMKKEKPAYILSLICTYVLVFGLLIWLLIVVIPQIYFSLVDLIDVISSQYFVIMKKLDELPEEWHSINLEYIADIIKNYTPQLVSYITGITTNLIPLLYNTSVTVIKTLSNIIMGIIISIYMLGDKDNLMNTVRRFISAVIPSQVSEGFFRTTRESVNIFSSYVVGKTIDSIIIGVITFIVMRIFRLDFSLLISVCVGITNMIPYFGPFIGGAVGVVILLIQSPVSALIFGIIILVIQQFDGLYLGPKILGQSTGLKPLWVIFAILAGGSMFGVMGMLIGVPTVAVLSYILNIFIEYRLKSRDIQYNEDGKVRSVNKKKKGFQENETS